MEVVGEEPGPARLTTTLEETLLIQLNLQVESTTSDSNKPVSLKNGIGKK